MKNITLFIIFVVLVSCSNTADNTLYLQKRIDSLETKLSQTYKPGLGEFMGSIQLHHAKLWFAGENQNWSLANFETGEIKEALEAIPVYCADRPEVQKLEMINPALDSLNNAINAKNPSSFKSSFILLTSTCNNCHRATNHAFNVIKIPEKPPFTNQDFKIQ